MSKKQDKQYKTFTLKFELGEDFNNIGNIHSILQHIRRIYDKTNTVKSVSLEEVEEI